MAGGNRCRVLIVDDDEVILATTEAILQAAGFDVSTHKGPFGASSKIVTTLPDLVLLDVNMPGLSGPGLAALVRDKPEAANVRIYYYSSSEDAFLQQKVEETGADGTIRKGDRSGLGEKVARALDG
jgi:PleD family two-component response regulator